MPERLSSPTTRSRELVGDAVGTARRSTPAPSRSPRSRPARETAPAQAEGPRLRGLAVDRLAGARRRPRRSSRRCLPLDDPREITTEIARRGPFADAGTAPGHLLGGDGNGRDMLSRLIWGGRTSLVVATRRRASSGSSSAGLLGLSPATSAGKVDTVVSLILDVFLAIPALVLALALVTVLRTQPGTTAAAGSTPRSR